MGGHLLPVGNKDALLTIPPRQGGKGDHDNIFVACELNLHADKHAGLEYALGIGYLKLNPGLARSFL